MEYSENVQKAYEIFDNHPDVDFETVWEELPYDLSDEEYVEEYRKRGLVFSDEELEILGLAWDEIKASGQLADDPDFQALPDEALQQVDGGMKIVLIKPPKIITPILRIIFNMKKKQN